MKRIFLILITFLITIFHIKAQENSLPQLYVTYDENALNYDSYIPGSVDLTDTDGTNWKLDAQFKTRGATARQFFLKPSLNMKLRDSDGNELDTDLLGLRKASSFILDAMAIDRINMRNRVAFDIWNEFSRLPYATDFDGRNGTVGKYVEMFVNGKYKGIYCLSDKINRKLLDLKKPEVDEATGEVTIRGILYKHGTTDIEDQNTPGYFNNYMVFLPEWHDAWELHEPEDYASREVWTPLADFYDRPDNYKPNYENYSYVKEHFWMENLADFAIHTMVLGIADNWGNKNKYFSIQNVSKNDDRRCFVVTPWDLDTSLGGEYDGSMFGGNLKEDWGVADAERSAPKPLSICFAQQEFRELMKRRWLEGRTGAFSVESVSRRLRETAKLFIESGAWQRSLEARNAHDFLVTDLNGEIDYIIEWYSRRYDDMDAFLGVTDDDIIGAGIEDINEDRENIIFNLQGVRVRTADIPGLYIINGKKVLVK